MYGDEESPHAECRERIADLEAEVERLRAERAAYRAEAIVAACRRYGASDRAKAAAEVDVAVAYRIHEAEKMLEEMA